VCSIQVAGGRARDTSGDVSRVRLFGSFELRIGGRRLGSRDFAGVKPRQLLELLDRGADTAAAAGAISEETAESCKKEARHRVRAGTFFGHIAYASLIARKLAAGMSRPAGEPDHP